MEFTKKGIKAIKGHPFFKTIDWDLLANEKVMGPLNPALQHDGDTHNFHKYSDSEIGVQMESPKAPRLNSSVFDEFWGRYGYCTIVQALSFPTLKFTKEWK